MYPVFYIPYITSGWIIGIIATLHILPSHLSTSAMWFNVYVEWKAYKENRPQLLEFVKKYALLLLTFAYVFGSLSGVGIWFSIMAAMPRGTSGLIHNYVWGWATEWVFFIIEVTGIFVYYYTLGKVNKKTHLIIGLIFAIGSWTTMAIIVGILSFMLSPGKWVETGNFFDGFFNQTYFTQFFFRTAIMFSIAALYAILTASFVKNEEVKEEIVRKAGIIGILSIIISIPFLFLYLKSLPVNSRELLSLIVSKGLKMGFIVPFLIVFIYFIFHILKPRFSNFATSLIMLIILFFSIFSGERIREILRKPYVIPQYMYSNGLIAFEHKAKDVKSDIEKLNGRGILEVYPFTPLELKEIREDNMLKAGKLIALIECSHCHSLEKGGVRPLKEMIERMGFEDEETISEFLTLLGESYSYMPLFIGNEIERKALAKFLLNLKGR